MVINILGLVNVRNQVKHRIATPQEHGTELGYAHMLVGSLEDLCVVVYFVYHAVIVYLTCATNMTAIAVVVVIKVLNMILKLKYNQKQRV
jgi:hypothetical protein